MKKYINCWDCIKFSNYHLLQMPHFGHRCENLMKKTEDAQTRKHSHLIRRYIETNSVQFFICFAVAALSPCLKLICIAFVCILLIICIIQLNIRNEQWNEKRGFNKKKSASNVNIVHDTLSKNLLSIRSIGNYFET